MRLRYSVDDPDYSRELGLRCHSWLVGEGFPEDIPVIAAELVAEGVIRVECIDVEMFRTANLDDESEPWLYTVTHPVASLPPYVKL